MAKRLTVTPRDVWKEAFAIGVLARNADTWTQAQRMRNLTVHTYDETIANEVYRFASQEALPLFKALKEKTLAWMIA